MKKKKGKLLFIVIFILLVAFIVLPFFFRLNLGMFSNVVYKTHNSSGLDIGFKVPREWLVVEYPNVIVIGSNQNALNFANNIDSPIPDKKNISIIVSLLHPLQNQTIQDYIDKLKENAVDVSESGENVVAGYPSKIFKVTNKLQGQNISSKKIYIDKDGLFYVISATPADSELMSVFEEIVKSIKFQ